MRDGEPSSKDLIVDAIEQAERRCHCEIRVHISRRWSERDALDRASRIYSAVGLGRGPRNGAVLLYLNLRKRRLAVVACSALLEMARRGFWESLAAELCSDLKATHPENAIALAVGRIGDELAPHFSAPEASMPPQAGED